LSNFTAFFDTNVLVPGSIRDLLMQIATTGVFRAKWSQLVMDDLRRILIDRLGRPCEKVDHLLRALIDHARDPIVVGFEPTIAGLTLPDPDDRHVLAAAIHANAGVIVTFNLKHFPEEALFPFAIEAQHPDEFIANLLDLHPGEVLTSVRTILGRLRNPPKTLNELLATYHRNQLVRTAVELQELLGLSP
jgi:predicted nucleic acid-binding protein